MKTTKIKNKNEDKMRAKYDFSKAERGKFYRPLDKGYTVRVKQNNGKEAVIHYRLAKGTILVVEK